MVWADPQVRPPNRLIRRIATDTAARPDPLASAAWVDPDAVRLAADLPDPCLEAVPDFHP
jgi:hypothetical protein